MGALGVEKLKCSPWFWLFSLAEAGQVFAEAFSVEALRYKWDSRYLCFLGRPRRLVF